jgi:hypothetical protein
LRPAKLLLSKLLLCHWPVLLLLPELLLHLWPVLLLPVLLLCHWPVLLWPKLLRLWPVKLWPVLLRLRPVLRLLPKLLYGLRLPVIKSHASLGYSAYACAVISILLAWQLPVAIAYRLPWLHICRQLARPVRCRRILLPVLLLHLRPVLLLLPVVGLHIVLALHTGNIARPNIGPVHLYGAAAYHGSTCAACITYLHGVYTCMGKAFYFAPVGAGYKPCVMVHIYIVNNSGISNNGYVPAPVNAITVKVAACNISAGAKVPSFGGNITTIAKTNTYAYTRT